MSMVDVCLIRSRGPGGESVLRLGVEVLDDYLVFVAGRCRPNTVLAVAYDLKVFFCEIEKEPAEVTTADVLAFIKACLLYTSPSPRDRTRSRMPSSA